jgi:hypothetical protein
MAVKIGEDQEGLSPFSQLTSKSPTNSCLFLSSWRQKAKCYAHDEQFTGDLPTLQLFLAPFPIIWQTGNLTKLPGICGSRSQKRRTP